MSNPCPIEKINMTTSTHRYHGYELVLYQANDDRYHVTIFDPKGNRIASRRKGSLPELRRLVEPRVRRFELSDLRRRRPINARFKSLGNMLLP